MDLFATNAYSLCICPVEFLLLSSIKTMKTPYGQTRGLYVYVANKSIHRFRVQKTTCNHYANFLQMLKLQANFLVKTLWMNEFYNFTTFQSKLFEWKSVILRLLQLKRLWENISKYLILSCTCFCSIPCWRALMAWKARARIMLIYADNQVILKNTNRLNVSLDYYQYDLRLKLVKLKPII